MNCIKSNGIQRNPVRLATNTLKFTIRSWEQVFSRQICPERRTKSASQCLPFARFDIAVYGIIYGNISRMTGNELTRPFEWAFSVTLWCCTLTTDRDLPGGLSWSRSIPHVLHTGTGLGASTDHNIYKPNLEQSTSHTHIFTTFIFSNLQLKRAKPLLSQSKESNKHNWSSKTHYYAATKHDDTVCVPYTLSSLCLYCYCLCRWGVRTV